jgi:hypothetical protein
MDINIGDRVEIKQDCTRQGGKLFIPASTTGTVTHAHDAWFGATATVRLDMEDADGPIRALFQQASLRRTYQPGPDSPDVALLLNPSIGQP